MSHGWDHENYADAYGHPHEGDEEIGIPFHYQTDGSNVGTELEDAYRDGFEIGRGRYKEGLFADGTAPEAEEEEEEEVVPDYRLDTIQKIKKEAEKSGSHWFDPETMRFFDSRLSQRVYPTLTAEHGTFFVSSEVGENDVRRYTVRKARYDRMGLTIDTVDEYRHYATREAAHKEAKRLRDEFRFRG